MSKLIFVIPIKPNCQNEYIQELAIKLNDLIGDDYIAKVEYLAITSDPIGIGIFKNE